MSLQIRDLSEDGRGAEAAVPAELLISMNLRCPQLVDQFEFCIREEGVGGVELIAQIADRFIVGGLSEMMQSHRQGFLLEIWNQVDLGVVNLAQQCARIVGPAELVAE